MPAGHATLKIRQPDGQQSPPLTCTASCTVALKSALVLVVLLIQGGELLLQRLEEVMERKNGTIRGLQYDLSKVCKAHNDLIRVYEAKLSDFGIPAEELGFRPLIINTTSGPAGLVVGA